MMGRMKAHKLIGAALLCASSASFAQTPYPDDAVYRGLGEREGIRKIVDDMMALMLADPRIRDSFSDSDIPELKKRLAQHFCELAGGPCVRKKEYRELGAIHEDLKVNDLQFNAVSEDLQIAMERQHVPTSVSNKLMAKLAPSRREIVTSRVPSPHMPEMGKLLATGGVSQVEGAGGGGIVPWALISGYGTRDSWGANAHYTLIRTQDYSLKTYGVAVGLFDRFEFTLAQQQFEGDLAPLDQLSIRQDIFGIKVRLVGEALYDQDTWLPQIAIGALYKKNKGINGLGALGVTNVRQLGAQDDKGYDIYLSATKLLLEQSLLLNGTLRSTRANQMGILGFGGDLHAGRRIEPEISAAYLLTRQLAAGAEWRRKPRNLGVDKEKNYHDLFLAWFPNRNLSLTAAYADLGDITIFNPKQQKGFYISAQVGF